MKNRLFILMFVALFTGIFIYSCDKETFSELDAYQSQMEQDRLKDSLERQRFRDSLQAVGGIIVYSVDVIDGSISSYNLKSGNSVTGMSNVIVHVSQYGIVKTDTTNASGIVVFNDLRVGTINVSITRQGYTPVDYVVEITPIPNVSVRQVANLIPLFSVTQNLSTVKGIVTYESSLINVGPEVAPNVEIKGIIDVNHAEFAHYINANSLYEGKIIRMAYQSVISVDTTDTSGAFSIQVPSSPDGLPIKFEISEFAVNQQLLMNTKYKVPVFGVQSIRTIFSSNINNITVVPSVIPTVPAAYVIIGEPTGDGYPQPSVEATAQAVISESGIASISISNTGEGYTQPPVLIISKGTGYNSVAATATATVSNGRVTAVTINSAGTGYKPTDNPTVTVTDGIDVEATAEPKMTYSIKDIDVVNNGSGYTAAPTVTIQAPVGTGATAQAVMSGYLYSVNLTSSGSGYTQTPEVVITGGGGIDAAATAVMSQYNPIHSIELVNFNQLYTNNPVVTITAVGSGSGATATATMATAGSVVAINLTNAGLGYTSAPTVTISGGGGFGASAYATLNGDGSINVILLSGGQGYTSDPTVSITPAPAGGTNASGTAQRGFKVQSITIVNPGSGYVNKPALNIGGTNLPGANYNVYFSKSVVSVNITNAGSNYSSNPGVTFVPVDGNGSGAAASTTIRYSVKDIQITNPGSGYVNDVVVVVAPPAEGVQATAAAVLGNGVLGAVYLTNGGQGYTAPPVVKLIQNGGLIPEVNAVINATVANGRVTGLTIANPGAGYDPAATYSIQISTKVLAASLSADVNPHSGEITFVRILNPGAGYVVAPVVEFEVPNGTGSGEGAEAEAVITDGRVSAINITNPGSGYYTEPTVRLVVPSHNLRAVGKCNVSPDGYINSVTFVGDGLTNGQGYVEVPEVTFYPSVQGMGQGAEGIAIVQNGKVMEIKMTNKGQGYLGKNRPETAQPFSVVPQTMNTIIVVAGKTYVRDIYLGTGKRTIED